MAVPPVNDPSVIEQAITGTGPIAMVGLSNNPSRDSYRVAKYLIDYGFEIIPVNPTVTDVLGRRSFPSLNAIPGRVKVVNVFRHPDHAEALVDEAVKKDAKIIWTQLGVGNDEAARKALMAGLWVVMDRCIKIEHQHRALAIARGRKL